MKRLFLLPVLIPLLLACQAEAPCEVTLYLPSALDAVPEGTLREVALRCGDTVVTPGSLHADTLESDAPDVASVRESWLGTTRGLDTLGAGAWYLLAHLPGTCRLTARRDGEAVASFDVRVVAR